jgi:NADP-dependent 3-hydroxy acid dehydrogenase YdfG
MRTNLKEKVALVTGASSGLGARFARVLAGNGALTVLASRRIERLKGCVLRSRRPAAPPMSCSSMLLTGTLSATQSDTERTVGPIDILVNNSGV